MIVELKAQFMNWGVGQYAAWNGPGVVCSFKSGWWLGRGISDGVWRSGCLVDPGSLPDSVQDFRHGTFLLV